jgi:CBS domain-containing protein
MVGPQLRFTIRNQLVAIGAVDVLVVLVFCWLVLDPGEGSDASAAARIARAGAITVAFFAVGLLLEQLKLRVTHAGDAVSPLVVSLFGGVELTRGETVDERRTNQASSTGFLIDLIAALTFAGLAALAFDESGPWVEMIFIATTLLMGMAALRLCMIQGLSGGELMRWYLLIMFDDDEGASQALKALSMAVSVLFLFCGFSMVVQRTTWNVWGLPVMAGGVASAALTQWYSRRERWARAASEKRVGDIGQSKLPTVRSSAPISELLSIFAVEGQRALVVVTDERGQPTGLIQLRQLRAAVHAGASGHPGEMMITLSDLPHVDRETTVLDAALFLERTGQLAMVFEAASGKLRVVSLAELQAIVD